MTSEKEPESPALRLSDHYQSTTLGGLVSEIAGHIPLAEKSSSKTACAWRSLPPPIAASNVSASA